MSLYKFVVFESEEATNYPKSHSDEFVQE
jgi:hypothetical protein